MKHVFFSAGHGGPRGRHGGRGRAFGWSGFGPRWGGRTRRGDMKYLVLEALADGPRHGYEIMTAIEERRGFRPSPGSIYPTLQMLEDGELVKSQDVEGKRVYTITEAGRELLANRTAEPDDEDEPDARHRVKESAMKLGAAVMSARGSDEATLDKIRESLDRARREIYAILAADEA
jgi:DNA-binding PadR family transcriptional regulator